MYLYRRTEPGLWTVGFYNPAGTWTPESDWDSPEKAAERVHWLNGGEKRGMMAKMSLGKETRLGRLERLKDAAFADWQALLGGAGVLFGTMCCMARICQGEEFMWAIIATLWALGYTCLAMELRERKKRGLRDLFPQCKNCQYWPEGE